MNDLTVHTPVHATCTHTKCRQFTSALMISGLHPMPILSYGKHMYTLNT